MVAITEIDTTADEVLKRHSRLKAIRCDYEPMLELCAAYFCPAQEQMNRDSFVPGRKKGQLIYDGSPIHARKIWADGMQSYIVSRAIRWFLLKLADDMLDDDDQIRRWLQECEMRMYAAFKKGNFYSTLGRYFDDAGWHGSPTLFVEEDYSKNTLMFINEHPGNVWFATDKYGQIDTWHREFTLTARSAVQMFGKDKVSEKIKTAITAKRYDSEFKFLHAIYPNADRDTTRLDFLNKPWNSVYIDITARQSMRKSGYDYKRALTWRVRNYSGEIYGRSPAADALVEALKLNVYAKTNTDAANLLVRPSLQMPAAMKPFGRPLPDKIYYYENDLQQIKAVHVPSELPAGIDREDRVRKLIEQNFSIDFFTALINSDRQKTAYEIAQLMGEKAQLMGPQVGSLEEDLLDGAIAAQFEFMSKTSQLPDPPQILIDQVGADIQIDYIGQLAQAQKGLFRMQAINKGLEAARPVMQEFPQAKDRINPDKLLDEVFEATAFPQKTLHTDDEVDQIRRQRAQDQQAAQQAQMLAMAADAVPKLQKKTEADSPLEAVSEQLANVI